MKNLLILICTALLIFSCSDSDESTSPEPFMPLAIGNYWVYQHYLIHEDGTQESLDQKDSIYIQRDSLIDGNRYFVLEGVDHLINGNKPGVLQLLRDSVGYLVNEDGDILMSSTEFGTVLRSELILFPDIDTLAQIDYQMLEHDDELKLDIGNFDVINYQAKIYSFQEISGVDNPRYNNKYFSEGVGPVLENYHYFSSPRNFERRLLEYRVIN